MLSKLAARAFVLEKALFINLKITHGGGWVLSVRLLHKKERKDNEFYYNLFISKKSRNTINFIQNKLNRNII